MVKKSLPGLVGGALTLGAARLAGGALTAVGGLASLTSAFPSPCSAINLAKQLRVKA